MSTQISCVAPVGCVLGEGPIWEAATARLLWVDIKQPAIYTLDLTTQQTTRRAMPAPIGAIGLRARGGLVGAFKNGFGFIDRDSEAVSPISDPEAHLPGNRFNDGKVDPLGRFWAGTMDDAERSPSGDLYRLDADLSVTRFALGFVCTNGIDWSGDGRTLYIVDSIQREIYAYDFDMTAGVPSTRRRFARLPDDHGYPDGLAIDADDHLWGAHWDGARITRYRPDGTIERVIATPVPRCTSCCFGGPDLDILFVTSASIGLDAKALAAAPLSGGVFAITGLGVRGRPAGVFRG